MKMFPRLPPYHHHHHHLWKLVKKQALSSVHHGFWCWWSFGLPRFFLAGHCGCTEDSEFVISLFKDREWSSRGQSQVSGGAAGGRQLWRMDMRTAYASRYFTCPCHLMSKEDKLSAGLGSVCVIPACIFYPYLNSSHCALEVSQRTQLPVLEGLRVRLSEFLGKAVFNPVELWGVTSLCSSSKLLPLNTKENSLLSPSDAFSWIMLGSRAWV